MVFTGVPAVNAAPPSAHGSRATLTLTPDQGRPGTRVTVHGYVPQAGAARPPGGGTINFGGWPDGLSILPNTVAWSKTDPGHFVTHFTVPAGPWLSPHGEALLKDGPQTVGVQCFGPPVEGCGLRSDQASAVFYLTGVRAENNPAPTLRVTPASARPGQTVTLTGWAPLTEVFGRVPFGYQLVWEEDGKAADYSGIGSVAQTFNGDLHGTVRVPAAAARLGTLTGRGDLALKYTFVDTIQPKHVTSLTLDTTPFQIMPAPRWTAVARHTSLTGLVSNQHRGYFDSLAVVGHRVFAASGGRLWVSNNEGVKWTALPTQSLDATIRAMGYSPFNQADLTGLVLAPGSDTRLFASMPVENPKEGAPPINSVGLYSPDAGVTWKSVPAPVGMRSSDFGGFQVEHHAVWAWWKNSQGVIQVEASSDGGTEWHRVNPSRIAPATLFLGPVPARNYGEMSPENEPLVEARHGAWKVMQSAVVNDGAVTQLAMLANGALLWVGNMSYPIQISKNGGRTFTDVSTPPMPEEQHPSQLPTVRLLPTGSLLAQDPQNGRYYALNRGSSTWIRVPAADVLANAAFTVAGRKVYWMGPSLNNTTGSPPRLLVVPVSRY